MNDVPSPSPRLPKSSPNALPGGTRLDEFEVLKLLGVGGFGIVYLAFDHALEREVAVKEYMPAHLAGRGQTLEVLLHSNVDAQTFAMGLRSFLNEARFLARFDHPSLLKVLRFWQANGTAYMAMPVLHGRTLSEEHQAMSAPPSQAWLLALIEPLLGALEKLHAQGVYHRDIAPDNIQIEPGGRPVLLDFGAARRVISDHSQALTAILKPAYSPIEQYAEAGAVKQGPWTDFYALGATLHCLLLGRPPPPATTRTVHDEPLALTPQTCPQCSAQFLQMVDWMLAPRPHDRPQSVAALRQVLEGHAEVPLRRRAQPASLDYAALADDDTVVFGPPPLTASPDTLVAQQLQPAPPPSSLPDNVAAGVPVGRPKSRSVVLLGSAAVALAALGVLAVMLWHMSGSLPGSASGSPHLSAASAVPATLASAPVLAAVAAAPSAPAEVAVFAADAAASAALSTADAANAGTSAASEAGAAPSAASAVRAPTVKRVLAAAATPSRPAAQVPTLLTAKPPPSPSVLSDRPPAEETVTAPNAMTIATPATAETNKPPKMGPEGSCAGLPYFKNLMCMERECLRAESQLHPDCVKWRRGANEAANK